VFSKLEESTFIKCFSLITAKSSNKRLIAIGAILFITTCAFCQHTTSSAWGSVALKKDLSKKINLKTELGYRVSQASNHNRYIDLAVKYKLYKNIKLSTGWRWGLDFENKSFFEYINRFNIDLNSKFKLYGKKLKLNHRIRYQKKFGFITPFDFTTSPNNTLRNRILLSYQKSKKKEFVIGSELFFRQNYIMPYFIYKHRGIAGLSRQLNKHHKLSLFYIFQHEMQVSNPKAEHIISLEYRYKL